MLKSNNQKKFLSFRSEFPYFIFEDFSYQHTSAQLYAVFHFNLADRYFFHPFIKIPFNKSFVNRKMSPGDLENLLFHIGMVELISYWKAACPPKVIIKPQVLGDEQVQWWKKLYFHGLGEFFYLNSIETTMEDFMQIESAGDQHPELLHGSFSDSVIIPVGGGKDSIVTLELLDHLNGNLPLMINPMKAALDVTAVKGYTEDNIVNIQRTIDPLLLDMNSKGFLNGHTPFSALIAFVSLLAAALTGRKYIALSNESSANEPTIEGTSINHQYSKSVEFEADFRAYVEQWICPGIEYFSFLRPLSELQIAKLFSGFPQYFDVFRSCNAGSKTGSWCGKCSKCLFTMLILSPFIKQDKLKKIFGKDLLNDPDLLENFNELTGRTAVKPFECIGTVDEVNSALIEIVSQNSGNNLPYLLNYYTGTPQYLVNKSVDFRKLLTSYDENNFLPDRFHSVLKSTLDA